MVSGCFKGGEGGTACVHIVIDVPGCLLFVFAACLFSDSGDEPSSVHYSMFGSRSKEDSDGCAD